MERNQRVVEELKKALNTEQNEDVGPSHVYQEYMIDGRRYGAISDIVTPKPMLMSPEAHTIESFINMLAQSKESENRQYLTKIIARYKDYVQNDEDLYGTQLYKIAQECSDKALSTAIGSTEREILLMSMTMKFKAAYC